MARKRPEEYPDIALPPAFEAAGKLKAAFGAAFFSRETAAGALGYAGINGAAGRLLRSLVSYGLLRAEGVRYAVADLSYDEALRHPPLFHRLLERYGAGLPERLPYVLVAEYGLAEKRADAVAHVLRQSLAMAPASPVPPKTGAAYKLALPSGVEIVVPAGAEKLLPRIGEIAREIEDILC